MIEALAKQAAGRWNELGGRDFGDATPSIVQIGGTNWKGGRVHFAFVDAEGTARLFARIMRNPVDDGQLEREHALLRKLAASTFFGGHVPEPYWFGEVEGRNVMFEHAAPGQPLGTGWPRLRRLNRAHFSRALAKAREIAVSLARTTMVARSAEELEKLVLLPLAEFWVQAGGTARELDGLFAQLLEALGDRTCTVVTHGDFIPKNLIIDTHDRCRLLDWETADQDGLPLLDLVYFVTRCAYIGALVVGRDKAQRVSMFYGDGRSQRARIAREALEHYCRDVDVSERLIGPVYRLHFLYKARHKARTTSLDNKITRVWLDLFRERLANPASPWTG